MARLRSCVGLLLAVVLGAACADVAEDGGSSAPLTAGTGSNAQLPTVPPPAMPPPPVDPGPSLSPAEYELMCTHYCETLEKTLLYSCLATGAGDASTCRDKYAGTPGQCHELRCVPRLVQPSLCFTQCDALDRNYRAVCEARGAAAAVCPLPAADQDRDCRAGCAPTSVEHPVN